MNDDYERFLFWTVEIKQEINSTLSEDSIQIETKDYVETEQNT
jgi:hypothetical protein